MTSTETAKTALWSIRLFQLTCAVILMGTLSFIIDEFREFSRSGEPPREVLTPEIFSILSIPTTAFGIAAVFFLGYYSQLAAAALDFIMWIGYLACAGLLRHNYRGDGGDGKKNPLEVSLNAIRRSHGARGHQSVYKHIVGLVSGLVVLQIILYFFSTILAVFVARGARTAPWATAPVGAERSRFSFSRNSGASSEKRAIPASAV